MKPRVILYTGKGGAGKAAIATATALWCAELGHPAFVMSADPAHTRSDAIEKGERASLLIVSPAFWWSFFVAIRLSLPGRFLRPRFSAPCCSWLPLPVSTSFRSDMERQAREEGES